MDGLTLSRQRQPLLPLRSWLLIAAAAGTGFLLAFNAASAAAADQGHAAELARPPYGVCGDKTCDSYAPYNENCRNCPRDCGRCESDDPPDRGCDNDGICEPEREEGTFNCGDCPSVCGDQICARHEVDTCAADCPLTLTCGDAICSALEDFTSCPLDCAPATVEPTATTRPAGPPPATDEPTAEPAAEATGTATDSPTATPTDLPTATSPPTSTATDTPSPEPETPDEPPPPEPTDAPPAKPVGLARFIVPGGIALGAAGLGLLAFFGFFRRRRDEDIEYSEGDDDLRR